jgi:anti-sigma-K factor RskA
MPEDPTIGVDERSLDDAALEALAVAHATPPSPALRRRVIEAARREAGDRQAARTVTRWRRVGSVAAAAALVAGGLLALQSRLATMRHAQIEALARTNAALVTRLDEQGRTLAALHETLAVHGHVLRVLGGLRTLSAALAPAQGFAGSGRVVVDAASGEAAVVVSGVGPAGAGRVYELWAIRGDRPPEPAGLFSVGAERAAAVRAERLERPAEVTAFAVSIEPEGGSASPTGPIVLLGAVAG